MIRGRTFSRGTQKDGHINALRSSSAIRLPYTNPRISSGDSAASSFGMQSTHTSLAASRSSTMGRIGLRTSNIERRTTILSISCLSRPKILFPAQLDIKLQIPLTYWICALSIETRLFCEGVLIIASMLYAMHILDPVYNLNNFTIVEKSMVGALSTGARAVFLFSFFFAFIIGKSCAYFPS